MNDPTRPDFQSSEYQTLTPKWDKTNHILGGTDKMREAAQKYLPQHPAEENDLYAERLNVSVLFNKSKHILNYWTSRPFTKELDLTDLDSRFVDISDDINRQGDSLTVFSRGVFKGGLAKGLAYVLVDAPQYEENRSLADQKDSDRPYWVQIPPENIIYKRYDDLGRLNYVTVREKMVQPMEFGEVVFDIIKIWKPGVVDIYQLEYDPDKNEKDLEWMHVDQVEYDLDFVPILEFYATDEENPPIQDIVELNISHWQSSSDQRSSLTVTRFPVLAMSGTADENGRISLGPRTVLHTSEADGKFYYVEHNGIALEHGRMDIKDLEEQMSEYGAEFLKKRPDRETATARKMDSMEATSPLQDIVLRFNDFLNELVDLTAVWYNEDDFGTVKVHSAFGAGVASDADIQVLKELASEGLLPTRAVLEEMKSRGTLSEQFDIDATLATFPASGSYDDGTKDSSVIEDDSQE